MEIGERIKRRREELGITQDELARMVGYTSKSTIAKIEANANMLRQSKIVDFAKALDVTPGYLMGWEMVDLFAGDVTIECSSINNERVHERLKTLYDSFYNRIRPYILEMSDSKREQLISYAKFLASSEEDENG